MFLIIQEFRQIIWDRRKKGGGLGFSMSFLSSFVLLVSEGKIASFHIPFTIVPTEKKLSCMDQTEICSVVAVVVHNTCHHLTQTLHLATPLPSRWQLLPLEAAVFPSPGHSLRCSQSTHFQGKMHNSQVIGHGST